MNYRLVVFDMDGVIFHDIRFWMELHKKYGTYELGKTLTDRYLHHHYDVLVQKVMALWKGKPAKPYYDLVGSLQYLHGIKALFRHLKRRGYLTAIISGSSIEAARRVQKDFGVDFIFANELVIKDGKLTGEFLWPVGAGKDKKAAIIQNLCASLNISPSQVIYIGDSGDDVEACRLVGKSIAFNSTSQALLNITDHRVKSLVLTDLLDYIP